MRHSNQRAALCLLVVVASLAGWGTASAQVRSRTPPACAETPGFHTLDFWLGEWEVYVGEMLVGTNHIEKILDGCALLEHWVDRRGGEGKSLFYFLPTTGEWKQVWVTERATSPGGVKEKRLVETTGGGSVRFLGEIVGRDGLFYLDRTTLTPLEGGRVRQLIEVSGDGGSTWRPTFDGEYRQSEER